MPQVPVNVTSVGKRISPEVIRSKGGQQGGPNPEWCPYTEWEIRTRTQREDGYVMAEAHWGDVSINQGGHHQKPGESRKAPPAPERAQCQGSGLRVTAVVCP